jgi:GDP-D-mannose dehydratase
MKTALITGIYGQDAAFVRPQHPWQSTVTFEQLSEMMMTADLRRVERKCD